MNRGLLHLGLAVMLEALHRPGAQEPTADRAQGLFNAGQLRYFSGYLIGSSDADVDAAGALDHRVRDRGP